MATVVLSLTSVSFAKTIRSVSIDSVPQATIQKEYHFTDAHPFHQIAIEPATYDDLDSAIPTPTLKYKGFSTYIEFWTCMSMSHTLFNSLDTLYECCKRDRLLSPYRISLFADSFTVYFEYYDGGCPSTNYGGNYKMYCNFKQQTYNLTRFWAPGDSIIYTNKADSIIILNKRTSSSTLQKIGFDPSELKFTNTAIRQSSRAGSWNRISMFNTQGQLIRKYDLHGSQSTSIEDINAGLYLCRIQSRNGSTMAFRFVKTQ